MDVNILSQVSKVHHLSLKTSLILLSFEQHACYIPCEHSLSGNGLETQGEDFRVVSKS